MPWLLRDGEVLASLEVADERAARPQGPAGSRRASTARCCSSRLGRCTRSGMRFPIDVAWLDGDLTVLRTVRLVAQPDDPAGAAGPQRARGRGGCVRAVEPAGGRPARAQGLTGAARPGGHPDRQPRRPVAARRRGARPAADAICCEDTRRTGRLLEHAGVARPPLIVVNDHTEVRAIAGVLDRLDRGERVAVVTDAGMPGISDPGERLVRGRRRRGAPGRGRAGAVGRRDRARRQRAAHRPVRVRGVPAAQGLGADEPARRARRRAAHGRALRGPAPARAHAGRPRRRRAVPIGGCRSAASSPSSTRSTGAAPLAEAVAWATSSRAARRARAGARRRPAAARPSTPSASRRRSSERAARRSVGPRRRRHRRPRLGVPKRRAYELAVQLRDRG